MSGLWEQSVGNKKHFPCQQTLHVKNSNNDFITTLQVLNNHGKWQISACMCTLLLFHETKKTQGGRSSGQGQEGSVSFAKNLAAEMYPAMLIRYWEFLFSLINSLYLKDTGNF